MPRPRSCGKINHIQWLRFRPAFSSSRAAAKTGACAITKRFKSKGSASGISGLRSAPRGAPPLVWGSLCQALSPPCERSLLDEIGTGLAALWAAPGRSTLYPVGPRRSPDQHPTFVGQGEAGRAGPIFATALVWGSLCQALSPPCERSLLDEIGTGLAALWAAPGRSTLYPVGPRRSPDQHPTFVGQGEAGRAGPIFATALVWGSLCQALSPPCERSLLDEIGTGLAALWAAPGRSTLYPVGPRRSPDQHPTFVGQGEAGRAGPIFATALWPWGTPVHARPASSRAASGRRSELTQTFNTAPSGTIPTVT